MYKPLILLYCVLCLLCTKLYATYNSICPSEKLWYLRAQSICLSIEKYTCLFDSVNNIYVEGCKGPRTDPPGDRTVLNSGNFDTKPCPRNRFQPFSFSSSQGSDCIFMKSYCSEKGQIVLRNGTTRNDRECRCDYTKSFRFLSTSRKHTCSCDPTKEDCSCYMKPCGQGKILSPDYHCIEKGVSRGKFVCEEIDIIHQTTYGTLREIQDGDASKQITRGTEALIATLVFIILTGIVISVLISLNLIDGIPQKIVKLLHLDNNPDQAVDHEENSSIHLNQGDISNYSIKENETLNNESESFKDNINNDTSETNPSTVNATLESSNESEKNATLESSNESEKNQLEVYEGAPAQVKIRRDRQVEAHSGFPYARRQFHENLPDQTADHETNLSIDLNQSDVSLGEDGNFESARESLADNINTDNKDVSEKNTLTVDDKLGSFDESRENKPEDFKLGPETYKCSNEISEDVLESYQGATYTYEILKDRIEKKIIKTYDSQQRTKIHQSIENAEKVKKAEHELVRNTIQKYKTNCVIQRTSVETQGVWQGVRKAIKYAEETVSSFLVGNIT